MDLLLAAALHFNPIVMGEMSYLIECDEGRMVMARIYKHETLSNEQKEELIQEMARHLPIGCRTPLDT